MILLAGKMNPSFLPSISQVMRDEATRGLVQKNWLPLPLISMPSPVITHAYKIVKHTQTQQLHRVMWKGGGGQGGFCPKTLSSY